LKIFVISLLLLVVEEHNMKWVRLKLFFEFLVIPKI
jgi:hypothetical protein